MAFPYNNAISEYVASFPASVYSPRGFKNEEGDGYAVVGEALTVPASADGEGKRRLNLDYLPLEQIGVIVTIAGTGRTVIPYGIAPQAGEVAISMETGAIEFHASDAGLSGTVSYTGRKTPIVAYVMNQLGKELAATQTEVNRVAGLPSVHRIWRDVAIGDAGLVTPSGKWVAIIRTSNGEGAGWRISRVHVWSATATEYLAPDGITTIQIAKNSAFTGDTIEVSMGSSEREIDSGVLTALAYTGAAGIWYVRVTAAGGHAAVYLSVELEVV